MKVLKTAAETASRMALMMGRHLDSMTDCGCCLYTAAAAPAGPTAGFQRLDHYRCWHGWFRVCEAALGSSRIQQ